MGLIVARNHDLGSAPGNRKRGLSRSARRADQSEMFERALSQHAQDLEFFLRMLPTVSLPQGTGDRRFRRCVSSSPDLAAQRLQAGARGGAPDRSRPRGVHERRADVRQLPGHAADDGGARWRGRLNPQGREIGIARNITLNDGGRAHFAVRGQAQCIRRAMFASRRGRHT